MEDSILDTIGSPLVRLASPEGASVAAKVESFNPAGSAKDRPALSMLRTAEREGRLEPGDGVVESTSGNTGIALAMACAARGYDLTVVMPASKSAERRRLMEAYGADVELVDGDISDANDRADAIAAECGAYRFRQFDDPANPRAHYETTGPELLDQLDGREVDAFVAAVGTGGTLTGVASRLREEFPDVEVVAVEPADNPVLSEGEGGEDAFQGMGPGFVSRNLDVDLVDDVETVALADAESECRRLAREEGILVGQSSGAASVAARRVAERLAEPELDCPPLPDDLSTDGGSRRSASGDESSDDAESGRAVSDGGALDGYDDCPLVVTVFADSGERYLSAGTFDDPD